MTETKQEVKPMEISAFLKGAVKSIGVVEEQMEAKGIGIRFSADYCNSIIVALKERVPELRTKSDAVVKLALKPFFEAQVLNSVARNLQVIKE